MQANVAARALLYAALQQQGAWCGAPRVCSDAAAAASAAAAGLRSQWWPSQLAAGPCHHQQQRQKHSVKMVLMQDHPKLGQAGEVVEVKAGYARHSLFPSGAADYAVPGVLRKLREQGLLRSREEAARPRGAAAVGAPEATAGQLEAGGGAGGAGAPAAAAGVGAAPQAGDVEAAIQLLSTRTLVIKRRHRIRGDFGMINSVGRGAIARAAAQQLRVTLPRDLLMLEAPISEYGEFKVPLDLANADGSQVMVRVEVLRSNR